MSVPPRPPLVVFWEEQARRFSDLRAAALRDSRRPPRASYHPDGWGLEDVRAFRGRTARQWMLDDANVQVMDEFKGAAAVCAVALGAPNTDMSWAEWLDVLRREAVDFQPGQFSTDVLAKVWRPEPDFEVVARGLLWEPLEIFPDSDPQIVTFELGEIEDVCRASDRVCRRLADEALRLVVQAWTDAFRPAPHPTGQTRQAGSTPTPDREHELVSDGSAVHPRQAVPETTENLGAAKSLSKDQADSSRTLTSKEAAKALRVSEDTLQRMRKRNEIEMFKVGSRWKVKASEVMRLRQQPKFSTR